MSQRILIVMAKRPFPGRTKTRLTPPLSPAAAAQLYECLLQDTLNSVRSVPNTQPAIAFSPAAEKPYFQALAPDFLLLPQVGETLSQRLDNVLSSCLQNGYAQVAAINSDSPALPANYLAQAFTELNDVTTELVLGPVSDGGYYLIGWKRPLSSTVLEVQMSTPTVLEDTLAVAGRLKLRSTLLPTWHDIDDIEDLRWAKSNNLIPANSHLAHFLASNPVIFSYQHEQPA